MSLFFNQVHGIHRAVNWIWCSWPDEDVAEWARHGRFSRKLQRIAYYPSSRNVYAFVKIAVKSALDGDFGKTRDAVKPNYPCHFEAKREICFSLAPADSRFLEAALLGMTILRKMLRKPQDVHPIKWMWK